MNLIEQLSHPVVHALAWTIIHSIWQVLIIVLLWRIALRLASKSSAAFRYRMSVLAVCAIPVSFVYTFFMQMNVYNNARQIVSVEFEPGVYMPAAGETSLFYLERGQPSFLAFIENYSPVVFWLYITGMLLTAIFSVLSYQKIIRLKRDSTPLPHSWQKHVTKILRRTRLPGSVPIRISSAASIPVVIGFFKPVVLLPAAILFSMTPEQVESIIMHELYHIRRHDHIMNMFQLLLEIVFFYHPAMWWISGIIRRLREESVDEWVVSQIAHPAEYAHALLHIEQNRGAAIPQPMVAATQSKNHLFTRIKHMMTMKTRSLSTGHKLATTLAFILAFGTVAWVKPVIPDHGGTDNVDIPASDPSVTFDISQYAPSEEAPDVPPPPPSDLAMADTSPGKTPNTIYLDDGTMISYEGFSEKDKEKFRKAMEEVRLAMEKMNEELREELQSEEFRQEMHQAREEIQQAMQELDAIEWDSIMHDIDKEIKAGMKELGPSFEKAMKELEEDMERLQEDMEEMEKEEQ
ncbi:MAG: M56 family metallopeptidase [Bacteroidales bacterium]